MTASLSGLTITGGSTSGNGGGLENLGTVTLTDCTISGNSGFFGGGVFNSSTATLTDCTVSGNSAGTGGGVANLGVPNEYRARATLTGCRISGNSSSNYGGGVYNYYSVGTLTGCTISGNSAYAGGGLQESGYSLATLTDCTISGNSATYGGGVEVDEFTSESILALTACTISGNSASSKGGGIYLFEVFADGQVTIGDTIVAGNTAVTGRDISGAVTTDQGYNLIGDGAGAGGFTAVGDQVGDIVVQGEFINVIDPLLASLGDYGGPTQTMALLPGSPAIREGLLIAGLTTDQRGFALDSPRPDIGAFQSNPLVVNTISDGAGSSAGDLSLRQAINLADVMDVAATINFDPTVFAAHQTIALTAGQLGLSDTGGLETIAAPAVGVTISGGGNSRVFVVDGGVTASLSGLTITGGSTSGPGGGLENLGTVTLTDCTVSGNSANTGGGVYNYGMATLTRCTISGNSAREGGGVYAYGRLTLTACTVSGNSADLGGGVALLSGAISQAKIGDTIAAGNTASIQPRHLFGTVTTRTRVTTWSARRMAPAVSPPPETRSAQPRARSIRCSPRWATTAGRPRPWPCSPAAPPSARAIAGLTTDQRGLALDSPDPDIGAFQSELVVNTTTDVGYGILSPPGELSLRQAVGLANFLGGAQTITFDPTVFAAHQTIRLTAAQLELSDTGGLETITAPAAGLTIDAGGLSRVFVVDDGVTASLSGLTITGGSTSGNGGGLENLRHGHACRLHGQRQLRPLRRRRRVQLRHGDAHRLHDQRQLRRLRRRRPLELRYGDGHRLHDQRQFGSPGGGVFS